jgi:hypothetical protein
MRIGEEIQALSRQTELEIFHRTKRFPVPVVWKRNFLGRLLAVSRSLMKLRILGTRKEKTSKYGTTDVSSLAL